jgi:hypothetical protein
MAPTAPIVTKAVRIVLGCAAYGARAGRQG